MDWSALMEGNGIVAWGMAFLLAVGGTAVVVAAWLQLRSTWRRLPPHLRRLPGRPRRAAVPPPFPRAAVERVVETPDPRRALRAYRDEAEASPARSAPPVPAQAKPASALSVEALDAYLERLHQAVDELEAAARTSAAT